MRVLNKLSINHRIQLAVGLILLLLYAVSGYVVYTFSASRMEKQIHRQMEVYLDNLSGLINEVEKQGAPGFDPRDYQTLKPYFSKPAYYSTDYPFMADAAGHYTIHLYKEGQRIPRELLNQLFAQSEKNGFIEFSEKTNNKKQNIRLFYQRIDINNSFIGIPVNLNEAAKDLNSNRIILILLVVVGSLFFIFVINLTLKPTLKTISLIDEVVSQMAKGESTSGIAFQSSYEVGKIVRSLNVLIEGLSKTATFATEIGHNNIDADFSPLGPNDKLGNALLDLRKNLKRSKAEEDKRQEEDKQRNWTNSGLATFADILRQNNNNLQRLSDSVVQNLLNYLNANQGGLFMLNEDDESNPHLELISAFAYNRKKFLQKTILLGEGLVGNCAIERQTIYLKEIPNDYLEITSGLGDAAPKALLITPLKLEDKVFGAIEIASFNEFKPFEIEFIEKIGESIASTLSAVKNSIRTAQLLEQSQQQREEMAAQEEEMRQNMEEMQATQEEMARKTIEMEGMSSAINEAMLFAEITENGHFLSINTNMLNTLGYTRDEMNDKTIQNFIFPTDMASFTDQWERVKGGEAHKGTIRWINRNNEEIYILSSISPAFDEVGDIFKIFFLGQDITATKQIEVKAQQQAEEIEQNLMELQAEQELAQQRDEEIAALLKALDRTCLVTEFDPNGRIIFINAKNEEVLGSSKHEIEGKILHEIDYSAKNNPQTFSAMWDSLLQGIPQQREFSLKVQNREVWISEHFTPIVDKHGEVVKIINIGIDISNSKEIEHKLQKQVEELTRLLRQK